ncbi:MAG: hypothetical protein M1819_004222 [Sarea resinae]|nr:MAG: hypothetical protein M1819_004222 [Sarea resinae]
MSLEPSSTTGLGASAVSENTTEAHAKEHDQDPGQDQMELQNMQPNTAAPAQEDDISLHARMGDVGAVQRLFESGKFDASYRDETGLTPLHWAAGNNHYALCKFLIDSGADVNAVGGELESTPAMWATKRCHCYVVNLLLQHGADPLLMDSQGFNMLHIATFDGNVFLMTILLHQNIPVDVPDTHSHTCLMWAAYNRYPLIVDLLLRWGANVYARDDKGFTALHWALVRGSHGCIQKLIEYGSDRFAETTDGKTPAITAQEMGTVRVWHRALSESGFNSDGTIKTFKFPLASVVKNKRTFMSRIYFLGPFLLIFWVIMILSHMFVYAAVPLVLFLSYSMQWAAQWGLKWAPSDMRQLHRTPWLAGIFAGTCFWVGVTWLTTLSRNTFSTNPIYNVIFGISYSLCAYFYGCSILEDPGYVPKSGSRSQQKAVVEELLSQWRYDEHNFCTHCMVRMPLRSKHCKRCARCIAKHDHHCPWIHNCVGVNNHRHFFLYIVFLEIGIILFVRLVLAHLENIPDPPIAECNILEGFACTQYLKDPFTIILAIWSILQLTWVTMLLFVQLVQISRAQTTYENVHHNLHPEDSMRTSKPTDHLASLITSGTTSLDDAQLMGPGASPGPTNTTTSATGPSTTPHNSRRESCLSRWKKLLGLDTFIETAFYGYKGRQARQAAHRAGRGGVRTNPFSRGILTNCKDFWCDPAPVFGKRESGNAMLDGEVVNYARMYDAPMRMSRGRARRTGDGGAVYSCIAGDGTGEGDDAV